MLAGKTHRLQDLPCLQCIYVKIYKGYCPPPDERSSQMFITIFPYLFPILTKGRRRISRVGAAYRRRKESSASPHLTMVQCETARPARPRLLDVTFCFDQVADSKPKRPNQLPRHSLFHAKEAASPTNDHSGTPLRWGCDSSG